eukprot:superscaffoldBa00002860_g15492
MDRLTLSHIDEELGLSEVAELCFLCLDVVNRKRLEGIKDAKGLFLRLEEKGLLENNVFLSQLLNTIRRADLLGLLETDSRRTEETDANPILSDYSELNTVLKELDQQLALTVQRYQDGVNQQRQTGSPSHVSMDAQRVNNSPPSTQAMLSISETQSIDEGGRVYSDAEANRESSYRGDEGDYYTLTHKPRGVCMIINNDDFSGTDLKNRAGTQVDSKALQSLFTRLGFVVVIHNDLTADAMRREVKNLGKRNFLNEDALVVCILSHGEKGLVFGTDAKDVSLQELTRPFKSGQAPTLAGKPKLFFIQACQGSGYQRGSMPCPPRPREEEGDRQIRLEEDAGRVIGETVPWDADFLLGMATVPEYKSFRNTSTGSIYIQELCRQLNKSAESSANDDILTVLTRVNREVSKGEFLTHKQMPEPKYTLTKKLVLKYV